MSSDQLLLMLKLVKAECSKPYFCIDEHWCIIENLRCYLAKPVSRGWEYWGVTILHGLVCLTRLRGTLKVGKMLQERTWYYPAQPVFYGWGTKASILYSLVCLTRVKGTLIAGKILFLMYLWGYYWKRIEFDSIGEWFFLFSFIFFFIFLLLF